MQDPHSLSLSSTEPFLPTSGNWEVMEVEFAPNTVCPVSLEIGPKNDAPQDLNEDITNLLLDLLRIESLERLHFDTSNPAFDLHDIWYQFTPICEALKHNTSLKSFRLDFPRSHEIRENEVEGRSKLQHLIREMLVEHNKTLEDINIAEYHPEKDESDVFRIISTMNHDGVASIAQCYKGSDYNCGASTMFALNMNKLGRKKLGEAATGAATTTVAEMVAMIDPQKIQELSSESWNNLSRNYLYSRICWNEEYGHLESDYLSLDRNDRCRRTLSDNYEFLHKYVDQWLPLFNLEVRAINLLYGMLREAPILWCRQDITAVGATAANVKKRKRTAGLNHD